MRISYQDPHLRDCCLLLKPASLNSSFTTIEIKTVRACIADLDASPKLIDSPLIYHRVVGQNVVEICHGSIKIICQIISSIENPKDHEIERLKILKILNTDLQLDLKINQNS